MPELNFSVTRVEAAARGVIPLLHFHLEVTNFPQAELIQAVLLQAQIQIQSAHRPYADEEKEKLVDLFGTPDRWGLTLRNRLWTHANTTIPLSRRRLKLFWLSSAPTTSMSVQQNIFTR